MSGCTAVYEPRILIGDLDLTELPFILEWGYKLGNGLTVYEEVESLLRDGTLVSSTKTANRELVLSVLIKSTTGTQDLADSGVLLDEECARPINTVTVYPGDYGEPGAGPALVLETFVAQSDTDRDPDLERAGYRRYVLTIPALPGVCAVDDITTTWLGPSARLREVTSTSGWTVSAGTCSSVNQGGGVFAIQSSLSTVTFTVTGLLAPLKDFLWIRTNSQAAGGIGSDVDMDLTITTPLGSTVIPDANLFNVGKGMAGDPAKRFIIMADVSAWAGTTPTSISFKVVSGATNAKVYGLDTTDYPNLPAGLDVSQWAVSDVPNGGDRGPAHADFGIGILPIEGTSRTRCTITFTTPTGGAFVIAGSDPYVSLRERGLQENIFGVFTVSDPDGVQVDEGVTTFWFGTGDKAEQVGRTAAQPPEIRPDGIWPQSGTGVTTIGDDATATMISYPAEDGARVVFCNTPGATQLVSPSPLTPPGYSGGAFAYEPIDLWPDGLFAVIDEDGAPIPATIVYRPRFPHYPNL